MIREQRVIPIGSSQAQIDTRTIAGATAAIVVAMINRSEGFSLTDEDQVKKLGEAIESIVPKFCETLERRCNASGQYAE